MSDWQYFHSGRCDPAFNMAVDDVLLQRAAETGVPVLRFYEWSEPAATFGYFQKIAELEAATHIRPLIRRSTGGGLVPHLADWTYSLTIPPGDDWYRLRAPESYRQMHEWIRAAMGGIGIPCELADCCKSERPGQCFAGYEKFDVLQGGRKIAGAAQRRNKHGLLIQGSIQPAPSGVNRAEFDKAMIAGGTSLLGKQPELFDPKHIVNEAKELAGKRYLRVEYNRRR